MSGFPATLRGANHGNDESGGFALLHPRLLSGRPCRDSGRRLLLRWRRGGGGDGGGRTWTAAACCRFPPCSPAASRTALASCGAITPSPGSSLPGLRIQALPAVAAFPPFPPRFPPQFLGSDAAWLPKRDPVAVFPSSNSESWFRRKQFTYPRSVASREKRVQLGIFLDSAAAPQPGATGCAPSGADG